MLIKLKLPESGMGITEGTIAQWRKAEGEAVSQGEVLAEVETAKAIQEVQSPIDGVLEKIVVPSGATAAVNSTIALLRLRRPT
jgi:pyruvate/2-oxoglutarate dehydrogenase complex dihydrolipoamide acyltransferase (E2) component